MANHCLQCISQLASLNGPVFPDDKAKCQYLAFFLGGFLPMLSRYDVAVYKCRISFRVIKKTFKFYSLKFSTGG